MKDQESGEGAARKDTGWNRRDFLKASGTVYLVAAVGCSKEAAQEHPKTPPEPPTEKVDASKIEFPPSQGYLLVDFRKCQGCLTCMLGCSLAHEGKENLSLARLQVVQDPFCRFPEDVALEPCRQCVDPECVKSCPTGALHVDKNNGNIRTVDREKCDGCLNCVQACPFDTGRAIWNHERGRAMKCDLCADAPYWSEKGGPDGKQVCVEVCPVGAIKLARQIPLQRGDAGYEANLRGEGWQKIGYAID
jgi:protein NrfC